MAIALKEDFIGFSFNGHRSESLGIVRVSDGSRYNEDLVPTAQDKTVQVPGTEIGKSSGRERVFRAV